MSSKHKLYLGNKILNCLKKPTQITPLEILPWIKIGKNHDEKTIEMFVSHEILENNLGIKSISEVLKIQPDEIIKQVHYSNDKVNKNIQFRIEKNFFFKEVIENCLKPPINSKPKTVVLEYSSPNIAKPFHFGHLRSTIVGNFLSNLHKFYNNNVITLNYLGDWGTQFGFIKIGLDELKYTDEHLKKNPLKLLYESYVYANKLAETDKDISERAKSEFNKLENGSVDHLKSWTQCMTYTKNELEEIYKRLGVQFDEYNYESMYNLGYIQDVLKLLEHKKVIQKKSDGYHVASINEKDVPILKSDGSTLYITRDIAAAIDRYNKFKFDEMYYVVDNSQSEHFRTLKEILHKMEFPWASSLQHVKFGRIKGMSTRRGNAVFLKDIIDECRDIIIQKQITSLTTKVPITDEKISDILGISCIIINDLKQRRQKNYEFIWDKVLQVQGDTGIKLQYTHCRLHSLEENCGVVPSVEIIPQILKEEEAIDLLIRMSKFEEVLYETEKQFESSILVVYLFYLCNDISKALKKLNVKGAPVDVGAQRLLLFIKAREVLYTGMTILGLKPLRKM